MARPMFVTGRAGFIVSNFMLDWARQVSPLKTDGLGRRLAFTEDQGRPLLGV